MSDAVQTSADPRASGIDVADLSVPKVGERANGDRAVSRRDREGRVLLAIVDGLGHGRGADEVAVMSVQELNSVPLNLPVRQIMERLHERLRGSRGVAATVSVIADGKIEACAVGNVELRCLETPLPFMFSPGILGVRVQKYRICEGKLLPGTRLVMFSDGISSRIRLEDFRKLRPAEACAKIIEGHRRYEDDATVLVADVGS
jgi:negative regulator of sigma-B (phosphoserine phosphatase)